MIIGYLHLNIFSSFPREREQVKEVENLGAGMYVLFLIQIFDFPFSSIFQLISKKITQIFDSCFLDKYLLSAILTVQSAETHLYCCIRPNEGI